MILCLTSEHLWLPERWVPPKHRGLLSTTASTTEWREFLESGLPELMMRYLENPFWGQNDMLREYRGETLYSR